jgi:hypothetical protein
MIITLVFKKNANFFAENCDHKIDPNKTVISPSTLYVVLVSHLHHLITGTPLVTLSRVAR